MIIEKWVEKDWNNIFYNPPTLESSGKIFCADLCRAKQTPHVKHWLHKCKATLINVPRGITSRVKPLDANINKLFKNYVRKLFQQHLDANLRLYIDRKLRAGKRTYLESKIGRRGMGACKQTRKTNKSYQTLISFFLSNNFDESENAVINIKGIEGYKMP